MSEQVDYYQAFYDKVNSDKELSVAYGLLRYLFIKNIQFEDRNLFLGEEFKDWDKNTYSLLINKIRRMYNTSFTIEDITNLWNGGDAKITYSKETIRQKIRDFERNGNNINQFFFSKNNKDDILNYIYTSWFKEDREVVKNILSEIHNGITEKYADYNQDELLSNLDKELMTFFLKDIDRLSLTLDTSKVVSEKENTLIFESFEEKRKALQNLEEQIKEKYSLLIDDFSSKYFLTLYGDLRLPLTNIPIEFLSKSQNISIDTGKMIVKLGESIYNFDIPTVKTEIKKGDKSVTPKQGNFQKVYNTAFVSEFMKFLREDLGRSNRQYKTVRFYNFPTRKEIYDSLIELKYDKELLIFRVGEYNNKIIAIILNRLISNFASARSKLDDLRMIFIIFFGIHYQATFNKYYKLSEEFPRYIMEKFILLSGQFFNYTLTNILFEIPDDYIAKMSTLYESGEFQNQLNFFNSNFNYINDRIKTIYCTFFLPALKQIEKIDGEGYIELSEFLKILNENSQVEGERKRINYSESCLMVKIIEIENSYNKIKNQLCSEFDYVQKNNGNEILLDKYLNNIADKLIKDVARHFNSFMFGDQFADWHVHFRKGSFYDKFETEFLAFKTELGDGIVNFINEKQFSDTDRTLLTEYLSLIGISI
ncbi:hypothetical protein AB6P12_08895 [Streptococcus mutans]|uniref:hypothetical protein n=1 Tax=Streptococcus mutans TaxID=1309 RepID=UPI0038BC80CA